MNIRKSQIDPETGWVTWRCTACGSWLQANAFSKHTRSSSGINSICNDCQKWRMKLRNYGITKQQYESILHQQGGVCAVCKCLPSSDRCTHGHLVVDHCHGSGLVRGLLCSRCNASLGESMDNVATLEAMISYIKQPPALPMKIKP